MTTLGRNKKSPAGWRGFSFGGTFNLLFGSCFCGFFLFFGSRSDKVFRSGEADAHGDILTCIFFAADLEADGVVDAQVVEVHAFYFGIVKEEVVVRIFDKAVAGLESDDVAEVKLPVINQVVRAALRLVVAGSSFVFAF